MLIQHDEIENKIKSSDKNANKKKFEGSKMKN